MIRVDIMFTSNDQFASGQQPISYMGKVAPFCTPAVQYSGSNPDEDANLRSDVPKSNCCCLKAIVAALKKLEVSWDIS